MSEMLSEVEHRDDESEKDKSELEPTQEIAATPEAPQKPVEQNDQSRAETATNAEKASAEARRKVHEIHQQNKLEAIDDSAPRSASRIIGVPFDKLEPVVETITKTWGSIRQNLKPSQQRYSKIIHNPAVARVSEFTAKTLARPYAILSGGVVAVIGSGIYLYLTRHLGYQYNYFVPILLFAAGLAAGIIVEMSYKLLFVHRKK